MNTKTAVAPWTSQRWRRLCVVGACILLTGCARFQPHLAEPAPFAPRVLSQERGGLKVSTAALGPEESQETFGVNLAKNSIQPVWLQIENRTTNEFLFLPASLDREYYSPLEAAYISRFRFRSQVNQRINEHFLTNTMPWVLTPESTNFGFVLKRFDPGVTVVNVYLHSPGRSENFVFLAEVPGLQADWHLVDFENLYRPDQARALSVAELRAALEQMPAATTNARGDQTGDPLNVAIVGDRAALLGALAGSGWDLTEPLKAATSWKTFWAFLGGRRYRTAPVSSLYVFGRPQDAAFQKARATVHERNHLRLWLTPLTVEGQPVWLGQISRDIGIRFTTRTWNLTTHKIDPDVDETRDYLAQDLLLSQVLARLGYVRGVGAAPFAQPRHNLTGDPYFTDGLRVVLFLSAEPTAADEIKLLDWESPPVR